MTRRPLSELVSAKGMGQSAEDFVESVNVAYHDVEAAVYDTLHRTMWNDLGPQLSRLGSYARAAGTAGSGLSLLDVGCGTGLASWMLAKGSLGGGRLTRIVLLDTSTEMLAAAHRRLEGIAPRIECVHGTVDRAVPLGPFDCVVASSLLHHLHDIQGFCARLSELQAPDGVFLHVHDPNAEALTDRFYQLRKRFAERLAATTRRRAMLSPRLAPLARTVGGYSIDSDSGALLKLVNARLVEQGVLSVDLSAEELWSVTDPLVEDLPFAEGGGVSIEAMKRFLAHYELLDSWSYDFFGRPRSSLPALLRCADDWLGLVGASAGRNVAAAWRRARCA